jgi:hypothetical protein
MSALIDRADLGFVAIAAGLAWWFDQPAYLVGVGIGLVVFAPLGEALGTKAARRLNRQP